MNKLILLASALTLVTVAFLSVPTDATTLPTPGYVAVTNGLTENPDGTCEGDVVINYGLRTVDLAAGVKVNVDWDDCSLSVDRRNAGTEVTVGTTGPVSTKASWPNGDAAVRARFLEYIGGSCARVKGEQEGTGGGFSPAGTEPFPYGDGCTAGWYQTWSGSIYYLGKWYYFEDTLEAGLERFGVPHCRWHISASDGSSGEGDSVCEWDDGSTVEYSDGVHLVDVAVGATEVEPLW